MRGKRKLSPRDARTESDLCSIGRTVKECGEFCMSVDEREVYIWQQQVGEHTKQRIYIPKRAFNRLVEFYARPQVVSRAARGKER